MHPVLVEGLDEEKREEGANSGISSSVEADIIEAKTKTNKSIALDVEIEYVPEEIQLPQELVDSGSGEFADPSDLRIQLQRLQEKFSVGISSTSSTDASTKSTSATKFGRESFEDFVQKDTEDSSTHLGEVGPTSYSLSKRKLREQLRPTVAELKRRVERPDLVEAHDITSPDPEFLIQLKAAPGTVPVPRHWGRKRKYLQGKRGFEKPPFALPDFIVKTGITELRDTLNQTEASQSAKQKNRSRVAPKMGAMDVDYRTLHDAFFKYQTKPANLTQFGDLYFEGKELQVDLHKHNQRGGLRGNNGHHQLSEKLRAALGMTQDSNNEASSSTPPPPWLWNMQRYGPPPAYPHLAIPGLNAPLPLAEPPCQYGFHPGGWGKPPLDAYGRPMFGGNPLDPPGTKPRLGPADEHTANDQSTWVTSDGKTITKEPWGALPTATSPEEDEDEDGEDASSEEESDMQDSDEEGKDEEAEGKTESGTETVAGGVASVLPLPPTAPPVNLRKQPGDETPAPPPPPKALYQVLETTTASQDQQLQGTVFASQVTYRLPTPAGAESVLSKAPPHIKDSDNASKRHKGGDVDDENEDDVGKNFKF